MIFLSGAENGPEDCKMTQIPLNSFLCPLFLSIIFWPKCQVLLQMSTRRWSVFSRKNCFAGTFPTWMLPLKFNVFLHICTNCVCVWAFTSHLKSLCSLDFEQMDENRRVDGQMCWNSRRSLKMAARVRTEDWRPALSNASLPWMMEGGTTQTSDARMRLQKETEKLRGLYEANNSKPSTPPRLWFLIKYWSQSQKTSVWPLLTEDRNACDSCRRTQTGNVILASVLLDILFFMTQSWRQNPALAKCFHANVRAGARPSCSQGRLQCRGRALAHGRIWLGGA